MITTDKKFHVLARDKFQCRKCSTRSDLQVDHVIPESFLLHVRASESVIDATWNLQTLCREHNMEKGDSYPSHAYAEAIRALDGAYHRELQRELDRDHADLRTLRTHPRIGAVGRLWEELYERRRRDLFQSPARFDLPEYWEAEVAELFDAGATDDDFTYAIDRAVSPSTVVNAWSHCVAIVRDRASRRGPGAQIAFFQQPG